MQSENARNILISIDVLKGLKREFNDPSVQSAINNCLGKLKENLYEIPTQKKDISVKYRFLKARQILGILEILYSQDEKFLQDLGIVVNILDEKLNEIRKEK